MRLFFGFVFDRWFSDFVREVKINMLILILLLRIYYRFIVFKVLCEGFGGF